MTTEGVKKTKFKVKPCGKFYLHHKSHLNDPTLQPRRLDASENIFDIILPWVPEQKQEIEADLKEQIKLGLVDEKEAKKKFKGNVKADISKKKSKSFTQSKLLVGKKSKDDEVNQTNA